MTKSKTTKRALLSSAMALLLCFTMLLGTTFAWFTDTVTNGVNKIVSGNLDVVLEHKRFDEANMMDMTDYEIVKADTKLFANIEGKDILWEPGAQATEYFKITNNGSLALKYQFTMAFANATENTEGKTLADVLSIYGSIWNYHLNDGHPGDSKILDQKDSGLFDYPGTNAPLKDFVLESYLLPGESIEFQLGVEWIPSDKDNEYNVKDGLSIDLGVSLLATQHTYEKDATGDQYDEDATYPEVALPPITNAADLQAALNDGGEFVLGADIALDEALEIPANTETSLNLAGFNVKANYTVGEAAFHVKGGTLTLVNREDTGAITVVDTNDNPVRANYPAVAVTDNGTLIIEDGEISAEGFSSGIQVDDTSTVMISGGKIIVGGNTSSYGVAATSGSTVIMNGGEIVVNGNAAGIMAVNAYDVNVKLNSGKISVNDSATGVAFDGKLTMTIAKDFVFDVENNATEYVNRGSVEPTIVDLR